MVADLDDPSIGSDAGRTIRDAELAEQRGDGIAPGRCRDLPTLTRGTLRLGVDLDRLERPGWLSHLLLHRDREYVGDRAGRAAQGGPAMLWPARP